VVSRRFHPFSVCFSGQFGGKHLKNSFVAVEHFSMPNYKTRTQLKANKYSLCFSKANRSLTNLFRRNSLMFLVVRFPNDLKGKQKIRF